MLEQCQDFKTWVSLFGWCLEPRVKGEESVVLPFIPWRSQLGFIEALELHAGHSDVIVEKTRGAGASWIAVLFTVHQWLLNPSPQFIGFVSRTELAADSPQDPDSLGYKIDWTLKQLPTWMLAPEGKGYLRNVARHTWVNLTPKIGLAGKDTFSTIASYSLTGDLAAGGRKRFFVCDELARWAPAHAEDALEATEPVTESRIMISTHTGPNTTFARAVEEDSSAVKIRMPWTEMPMRSDNMFRIDSKRHVLLHPTSSDTILGGEYTKKFFDKDYPILLRRGYDVTSNIKLFSPWYVDRCLRPRMGPRRVAQEYDIDVGGSGSQFFQSALIESLAKRTLAPRGVYDLDIHPDKFIVTRAFKSLSGPLRMWVSFNPSSGPPKADYVIGADVAAGTGGSLSSNSVLSIVDRMTGSKVAEYVSNRISPESFGELSVALCRWFRSVSGSPAHLCWESNGYGSSYGNRVVDLGFGNFYYRQTSTKNKKRTKAPGFATTTKSKPMLLSRYRWALTESFFENPSLAAVHELACYAYGPSDRIVFSSSSTDDSDLSASGQAHADRVIADALANLAMEELSGGAGRNMRKRGGEVKTPKKAIPGSFLWRQQRHKDRVREEREQVTTWSSIADNR